MRNPAIHIKRSDLSYILLKYGIKGYDITMIMQEAMQYSVKGRINVILPRAAVKKLEKITEINSKVISAFNRVYTAILMKNNIKALTIHTNSDKRYLTLVDIAKQAVEFCDLFELDYTEGFGIYVQLGIDILKRKFNINILKGTADQIVTVYRNIRTIEEDPTPEKTVIMYQTWQTLMKKYFQKTVDIKDNPDKYIHFVFAKEDADSVGANYIKWLEAQFESWKSKMPYFTQLYGDNAKLNYQIYIGKHAEEGIESKFEKNYFKAVESGKTLTITKPVAIRGKNKN